MSSYSFVAEVTFNSVRNILSWFFALHSEWTCTAEWTSTALKAPSFVAKTGYQNKTSLPCVSPKFENDSFVKFSNCFGIYYLIWNLSTIFVKYLSKNRDMISTLSRKGCVLNFVNSRLPRGLYNHLQCVIFVRCYQYIIDAVVVVHDLRDNVKFALELTILLS